MPSWVVLLLVASGAVAKNSLLSTRLMHLEADVQNWIENARDLEEDVAKNTTSLEEGEEDCPSESDYRVGEDGACSCVCRSSACKACNFPSHASDSDASSCKYCMKGTLDGDLCRNCGTLSPVREVPFPKEVECRLKADLPPPRDTEFYDAMHPNYNNVKYVHYLCQQDCPIESESARATAISELTVVQGDKPRVADVPREEQADVDRLLDAAVAQLTEDLNGPRRAHLIKNYAHTLKRRVGLTCPGYHKHSSFMTTSKASDGTNLKCPESAECPAKIVQSKCTERNAKMDQFGNCVTPVECNKPVIDIPDLDPGCIPSLPDYFQAVAVVTAEAYKRPQARDKAVYASTWRSCVFTCSVTYYQYHMCNDIQHALLGTTTSDGYVFGPDGPTRLRMTFRVPKYGSTETGPIPDEDKDDVNKLLFAIRSCFPELPMVSNLETTKERYSRILDDAPTWMIAESYFTTAMARDLKEQFNSNVPTLKEARGDAVAMAAYTLGQLVLAQNEKYRGGLFTRQTGQKACKEWAQGKIAWAGPASYDSFLPNCFDYCDTEYSYKAFDARNPRKARM